LVQIRKILCPVDFFPPSEAALWYAASLAKNYGAGLHVVHVIPPVSSFMASAAETGELVKSAHHESDVQLAKMANELNASGVNASVEVRFGEIDREILNAIDEYDANLVVAGTHGRRGFQHWLLGSVCEHLLRRVPVPILTVRQGKGVTGFPGLKRILIAIDFSPGSTETASWGASIAQQFQAGITLLHVSDFVMGDVPDQYRSSLLQGIRLEMENLVPAEASREITTSIEFGIPFQLILNVAESTKADMIVLGTHGKSTLDRMLVGTTAERVIRGAPCPVLAIPPNRPA
jgi:nucleotide-binding universal stress UspA family protein